MRLNQEEKILNLTSQQYKNCKMQQEGYLLLNRYKIISQIGFGTYGEVYEAYEAYDNEKLVAIKIINLKKLYQKNRTDLSKMKKIILREEQNMKKINSINSEHIVKYYQSMLNKDGTIKAIIMERCQGPTLAKYITDLRNQKKGITEQQALQYIYQIAEGLNDLHRLKIMHRDLHPGNIMFHKGKLIIIDLGLSKLVTMSQKIEQATVLGNPITVAPQIVDREHKYGMKVDVWSLGVILYYLLTAGKYPFKIQIQNRDSQLIHSHIRSILQLQFNTQNRSKSRLQKSKVSQNTRNFLQKLLCFYHQKRYNVKEVLNDNIFGKNRTNEMIDERQEQEILYKNEEYLNNYMGE